MNNTQSNVAAFSSDHDFVLMIENSEFLSIDSTDKKLAYSFRGASNDIRGLADHDAVIYDLDLAGENVLRAKEDILHLKLNSRSKPLVLVGQKEFMQTLVDTGSVAHLVSRKVAKPVLSSHLELVVTAAISDQVEKPLVSNKPKSKYALFAFGSSCVAVIATTLALTAFSTSSQAVNEAALSKNNAERAYVKR